MKPALIVTVGFLALFLVSCGRDLDTPTGTTTAGESESTTHTADSETEAGALVGEAFLRDLLEAQLKSATKMAREGKLESAIRQVEISQRLFPDLPQLETLHANLVKRREEAIRQQLKQPPLILNRNQLPPADRIAFSLMTADWNATLASGPEPTRPLTKDLHERISDFVDRYPDLLEARLLQARLGLKLHERHEHLIKARVIAPDSPQPTEGPEAAAKLADLNFYELSRNSPEIQELLELLIQRGWYRETEENPGQPALPYETEFSPLERIRQSLALDAQ
jgi:hypothetical protein